MEDAIVFAERLDAADRWHLGFYGEDCEDRI
jgi:hypothetical protein